MPDRVGAEGVAQVVEAQPPQLGPVERSFVAVAEGLVDQVPAELVAEDELLVAGEPLTLASCASAWATSSIIGTALPRPLFGVPSLPAV